MLCGEGPGDSSVPSVICCCLRENIGQTIMRALLKNFTLLSSDIIGYCQKLTANQSHHQTVLCFWTPA